MVHEQKLALIIIPAFRNKLLEGAFLAAKTLILNPPAGTIDNVKHFAQIVVREVPFGGTQWLDGLGYFTLSTGTDLSEISTQAQVNTQLNSVFVIYAKTHYSDLT